jgi:hypothetical protein
MAVQVTCILKREAFLTEGMKYEQLLTGVNASVHLFEQRRLNWN